MPPHLHLLASLPLPQRLLYATLSVLFVLGAFAFWLATAAHAQALTPLPLAVQTVDFGPFALFLIQYVGPAAAVVFIFLGVWVVFKLGGMIGLKSSAFQRAIVEAGFSRGADFVLGQLKDYASGGIPLAMKSQAIAMLVQYAMEQFPKALKYFGKSPEDLAKMAEARLQHTFVDPEIEAARIIQGQPLLLRS